MFTITCTKPSSNGNFEIEKTITASENLQSNAMNEKEKLDYESHIAAWHLVWLVENGHLNDRTSLKCAFDYLSAYADRYEDENCRFRAQKLKQQTN